ncbi:zinc finger protein [Lasius niger]|uniref:Zinc finger protein n=1 Tax=Lasius niger TaxID=67767 RepID=A0A0J7K9R3_LASNI|nr:zinc finger protein [Lasius niger]
MHRTKCSEIIKNVLGPHFNNELLSDIGNGKYSLLLDESNDVSVNKLLGIVIIYYSYKQGKTIASFLALTKLETCNAEGIVNTLKKTLEEMRLDLQNLLAIGTDNASVMVGINNGVYAKLKAEVPSLILIRCLCHSLQLAVSHAMTDTLPRNLEFLIHETYNWFSKSAMRQIKYTQLYETINCGERPLQILQVSDTRWLSIEAAVGRTLHQWLELKTHFNMTRLSEKCYSAEILYNMYCDETNMLYLLFLKPILSEIQVVNKAFQSEKNDHVKLLNNLNIVVQGISRKLVLPSCKVDPLLSSIEDYLDPKPYLGHSFEKKVEQLRKDGKINVYDEQGIRERCKSFLLSLLKQLKQRLPENVVILKKISLLSVDNVLRAVKEPIQPLLEYMGGSRDIDAIESQLSKINLIDWTNKTKTISFWDEVNKYRDASGSNPFAELATFALSMLILPYSNAQVERIFSQLNLVKNKIRNKMSVKMTNAILTIRFELKRNSKCCHNYVLPPEIIRKIGSKEAYTKKAAESCSQATDGNDDDIIDFCFDEHFDNQF